MKESLLLWLIRVTDLFKLAIVKRRRTTIYNWLTNHYTLILRSEETFAEKTTLRLNYAKVIVFVVSVVIILSALSFWLGNRWSNAFTDAGSQETVNRKKLVMLASRLDSLETELQGRDALIQNFRDIAGQSGKLFAAEAKKTPEATTQNHTNLDSISAAEEALRLEFEQNADLQGLPTGSNSDALGEMFFFKPVNGFISSGFDSKIAHYGADIVTDKNTPVKAIADGTVIVASWTQDTGNVIAIQHRNNLISIYKHNASLTRKVGDAVRAGELIALVGNSGETLTTGSHLHLEVWYNGNPINPQNFIDFQ